MIVPPKTAKTKWRSINIDSRMFEAIKKLLPKLYGYKGVADFCQVAIRRYFELESARAEMRERTDG